MMRAFDWLFWGFVVAICAMVPLVIVGIIMLAYNDITSEKISLTKSDWTCTDEKTVLMNTGKTVFPFRSCIKYERNDSQ